MSSAADTSRPTGVVAGGRIARDGGVRRPPGAARTDHPGVVVRRLDQPRCTHLAVRPGARWSRRRRLPAGDPAAGRPGAVALPGRVDPVASSAATSPTGRSARAGPRAARTGHPTRPQRRAHPERDVLRPAADRPRRQPAVVVDGGRDGAVLPLVLAARRDDGRRRPPLRVHGRDGRARPVVPVGHRTDRHPRGRHRPAHHVGRVGRSAGERFTGALRVLDHERRDVDLPVRTVPSPVRVVAVDPAAGARPRLFVEGDRRPRGQGSPVPDTLVLGRHDVAAVRRTGPCPSCRRTADR